MPQSSTVKEKIGEELRALRVQMELSQEAVGEVLGWNRDAISKVERGVMALTVEDYLTLMYFFRDVTPHHPAVLLATRYLAKKRPLRSVS